MIGEYRLVTQKHNKGHFARVCMEAEPSSKRGIVVDAIDQHVNRGEGEVNAQTHSDWVGAAIEGAKDTLRYFEQFTDIGSYTVKITKVIGLEVDTTEGAIRTAAAIATWRAINPGGSEPKPLFDGHWFVAFPKRV